MVTERKVKKKSTYLLNIRNKNIKLILSET